MRARLFPTVSVLLAGLAQAASMAAPWDGQPPRWLQILSLPLLGWRLLADALASIQIRLLSDTSASSMAQETTQQLFAALRQNLPADQYQAILAYSGQAVMAWQQSRRPAN